MTPVLIDVEAWSSNKVCKFYEPYFNSPLKFISALSSLISTFIDLIKLTTLILKQNKEHRNYYCLFSTIKIGFPKFWS